jgi:hypothetical protein
MMLAAHRLSAVKSPDRIIVMQGGEVVQAGPHASRHRGHAAGGRRQRPPCAPWCDGCASGPRWRLSPRSGRLPWALWCDARTLSRHRCATPLRAGVRRVMHAPWRGASDGAAGRRHPDARRRRGGGALTRMRVGEAQRCCECWDVTALRLGSWMTFTCRWPVDTHRDRAFGNAACAWSTAQGRGCRMEHEGSGVGAGVR